MFMWCDRRQNDLVHMDMLSTNGASLKPHGRWCLLLALFLGKILGMCTCSVAVTIYMGCGFFFDRFSSQSKPGQESNVCRLRRLVGQNLDAMDGPGGGVTLQHFLKVVLSWASRWCMHCVSFLQRLRAVLNGGFENRGNTEDLS